MKYRKQGLAVLAVLILLVICFFWLGFGGEKTYHGTDELMVKAREVIPISDADTAEMTYAGLCAKEDKALLWFISGNEYQAHYYLPMECTIVGENEYTYEHAHKPLERGLDIAVLPWQRGYAFLVNNPNCRTIKIIDEGETILEEINPGSCPYVSYYDQVPSEYYFLDSQGNEIR